MKLFTPRPVIAGFVSALMIVGIHACKKPTEDINLLVNTSTLSKAPTLVQFVNANAASGTALPSNFTIKITGTDAKLVQVDGGGTNFTVTNGILPLSLTKQANPSPGNPVTYTIYAEVPGFLPVAKTITVTGNSSSAPVIPLVEYAKPAQGTATVTKQTELNAGVTTATTVATTTTNATTTENSVISIPAGTQMLDAGGAAINSAQLNVNAVYFSTGNKASLNAFPGGFNVTNAVGPNGQAISSGTTFVTAGMLSINVNAGSTAVKAFSKPVTLTMEINDKLVNPQTHQLVKVGDVIPVWSLNEQTGQWKYESTTTISRNNSGKLSVSFPITHLSGWSANWYGATCPSPLTVKVHTAQELNGDFLLSLTTANEQEVSSTSVTQLKEGFSTVLNDCPADAGDLKIVVYSRNGSTLTKLGETASFSPCGQGSVDVTLNTQPAVDYIKTTIHMTAKCSTQQIVAYPSAWLTLRDATTGENTNVYMSDGIASANLINGHSYGITTTYSNRTYNSASFKLDKAAGIAIPAVNNLSGTANYDAATNSIVVDATFVMSNCN